jgi:Domain of unknown function (DUF4116)
MLQTRPRLEKILALHGQALLDVIIQSEPTSQEAKLSNKNLIRRFADMDPTPGKSRTQWMVKTYIRDEQFKLEDLGRAYEALAAFERFKQKLSLEQRELSRFTNLRDLEALVDPFIKAEAKARLERDLSSATGREKRRLEELKARDESIILQEAEGIPTIAVPMTEFASKWWGRGTKWCTAAENNNVFDRYHKDAPLIIIICPDGAKFQANVSQYELQFRDATDETVNQKIIGQRWNEFECLIYWMIEQNGMTLDLIPEEYKTPKLCRYTVEQNGWILQYVPIKHITPELCSLAIQSKGTALQYVPKEHKSYDLCRLAVEQSGQALRYVPEHKKTSELCLLAIKQDGNALNFIPHASKSFELCHIAVQQDGRALQYVPEGHKTFEVCCLAVQKNGLALQYVPHDLTSSRCENKKILELCQFAIQNRGTSLQFVPKALRTPELCRLAIQQDGHALGFVPENYKTLEFCRLAVQQNATALQFLPNEYKTFELYQFAIQQHSRKALAYIPEKYRTPELIAIIPSMPPINQQTWHPDILKGLCNYSRSLALH